ncbi:BlaI/MecI/CopY family transcriptional regulator [Nocardiopsis dassonvillei]|uniref:BlaI/MecI/CopY family transcriptional regulator n=1 Tax=Nocardiopsis dassonvillei TaxID=2014 RepID=UPI00034B33C8|nr:BlaI/MecI/CopY family transcriptional regulator [Nocardiopsis dassonvillei]MCK9872339.1 BlaI/MecI/CopY family transcriptional regulator [Nocardiopsis dassonvillei]
MEADVVQRFGALEAAIMEVVWDAEHPLLVREVLNQLDREPVPAFTTVQTVMNILHGKGWLDRGLEGRAYRYWATATREDYIARLMHHALDETQDRGAALARFVDSMDPGEIAELTDRLAGARIREDEREGGAA